MDHQTVSVFINSIVLSGDNTEFGGFNRYPEMAYTQEGDEVRELLWEETMEELNFAQVSDVVRGMGTS